MISFANIGFVLEYVCGLCVPIVFICKCTYLWRPEVGFWCLLQLPFPFNTEARSLTDLRALWLVNFSRDYLALPPEGWDEREAAMHTYGYSFYIAFMGNGSSS